MNKKRLTDEFKIEAVKQVAGRNHPVAEVSTRPGVSGFSLYQWIKRDSVSPAGRALAADQLSEMRRLKAELERVTEERDILKGRRVLCQDVRVRYPFIREYQSEYSVRRL